MALELLVTRAADGTTPDWQFYNLAIVMTVLAGVFVILRESIRLHQHRSLNSEDWFILIALLFDIVATVFDCLSVRAGMGLHNVLVSKSQLITINKFYYFATLPYKFAIGFTKLSILTLYYRVFVERGFRRILLVLMAYVALYTFATGVATILQCIPVEKAWNKAIPGTCVQPTAQWYSFAGLNMIAELLMFFLPMPMIKKLQLPRQQKIGLFLIFLVGLFVIFCSVMRLIVIGLYSRVDDTNYTWSGGNQWTTVELNTGIICACIPVLKAPFVNTLRFLGLHPSQIRYGSQRSQRTKAKSYGMDTFGKGSKSQRHTSQVLRPQISSPKARADSEERIIDKMHEWNIGGITKTTTIGVAFDAESKLSDNDSLHIGKEMGNQGKAH